LLSFHSQFLVYNGTTKYILKKLAEKYIDKNILSRKKMGFGVPIAEWIRKELKDYVRDIVLSEKLKNRNIFNIEYLNRLLDEHCKKNINHSDKIWAVMCLELWFLKFYDK
jgi:asparagine synthase (glutamine-hydrolysing)